MATPTFEELTLQLQNIVRIYDIFMDCASEGAANFASAEDTLVQSLESDFADSIMAGIKSQRSSLNAALTNPTPFAQHLQDWRRFLDTPATDTQSIISAIYQYFIDNAESVLTRLFVFGLPLAGGGNIGTGDIFRLNIDDRILAIENQTPDAKIARCISDANTGATRNNEVFLFEGGDAGPDQIEQLGSGRSATFAATDPESAGTLLNPSFDDVTLNSGGFVTDITDWVSDVAIIGDGTDYVSDTTNIYLPKPDIDSTRASLDVQLSRVLTQRIDLAGFGFNQFVPVFAQIAFNDALGVGGAYTGDLTLGVGTTSNLVSLTGIIGWGTLIYAAAFDETMWYRLFVEEALDITVTVARAAGSIILDDIILVGFTPFDGSWYVVVPGRTPFRAGTIPSSSGDTFTWADTNTESKIQRFFWRLFGRYLPHSGAPTVLDPV